MRRQLPAAVVQIGDALAASTGYLHNTWQEPLVTCATCSTPVDGYQLCYQCLTHVRSGLPLADRVASMVYAVKSSRPAGNDQTYTAMYGYKGAYPRAAQLELVRSLVGLAVVGHMTCDLTLSGQPLLRWATVPGTRHRTTEHPLHELVAERFRLPEYEIPVRWHSDATKDRTLQPQDLRVDGNLLAGTHVAVIDDSWVTGGSAQSVAIALHQAGAASVSILTLARVLGAEHPPNAAFIRSDRWARAFDYRICPWTGGDCP